MTESFVITVNYKGEPRDFQGRLERFAYTYCFVITIDGTEVNFEPDEEGHYRAVLPYGRLKETPSIYKDLLEVIGETIERSYDL